MESVSPEPPSMPPAKVLNLHTATEIHLTPMVRYYLVTATDKKNSFKGAYGVYSERYLW